MPHLSMGYLDLSKTTPAPPKRKNKCQSTSKSRFFGPLARFGFPIQSESTRRLRCAARSAAASRPPPPPPEAPAILSAPSASPSALPAASCESPRLSGAPGASRAASAAARVREPFARQPRRQRAHGANRLSVCCVALHSGEAGVTRAP